MEPLLEKKVRLNQQHKLQVRYSGRWGSIGRVLRDLPPPTAQFEELRGAASQDYWAKRQWNWWYKNGKVFKLLGLPLEIREKIYGFTFADYLTPYPLSDHHRFRDITSKDVAKYQVNMKLRRICRQVYKETGAVIFRHVVINITKTQSLQRMRGDAFLLSRLTKLRLALEKPHMYLQLFGLFVNWTFFYQPQESATTTIRLLKLKELVLDVPSPVSQPEYLNYNATCHRIFVNCILKASLDWVKGHPVRVTGWIKAEQKADFEKKCREERKRYFRWCEEKPLGYEDGTLAEWDEYMAEEDGGVRLDGQPKAKIIQVEDIDRVEREYPPICNCTETCSVQTWVPLD